jgi:hypothetical protein
VTFHAIEEGSTIVQVDTRQCSTPRTALRQRHRWLSRLSHRASKYELEALLDEGGERRLTLGRFGAGSLEQRFIQANGRSHMS